MYYSYNHFFELKKILLEKQRKEAHEGVRYITNINKDNMELVRLLIDVGIQIRHVKNLPPMSFGVSEKETAATIEKMQGGKKLQSLLISNDPLYATHFTSIFEELWKRGIDAPDRIMSVEEGSDTTNIEIIDNPRGALRLAAEIVGSAKEEVLRIYPPVNALRRQVRVGALDLFGKLMNRGGKVRMVIPSDDKELKSILDEVNEAGISPVLSSQLDIRSVDKSLQTHIGIIVVDRKESIIVESKDDTKDSYFEAAGLAAYSNSMQIALSYASIFESLWKQTEMYEQSRTYSRMQKEFINVAAHELRTPVQPIIGLADTLYSKAQDIRQKEALEIIFRNARRLQRLVEDILDVTKIESDSLNLNRERFNLEEVIEDAINEMSNSREFQFSGSRSSSSRKRVKIVFDGTIRTKRHNGVIVAADKGRIYQVISNLLSNAVKFTEKGVIAVSVNTRRTNGDRSQ